MSKHAPDSVGRLRSGDATALERRLLDAAGREAPSRELSARMAGAIGIALPPPGSPGAVAKLEAAQPTAAATSSLVPWISGALVAAVVAGAFVVGRGGATTPAAPGTASIAAAVSAAPLAVASASPAIEPAEAEPSVEALPPATVPIPAAPRARGQGQVAELSAQIALVDAARAALNGGRAERALSIARDYQLDYPTGAFRPEVGAIKVEALVKLGRKAEARALAERFVKAYGPGPLAERVARLGGVTPP